MALRSKVRRANSRVKKTAKRVVSKARRGVRRVGQNVKSNWLLWIFVAGLIVILVVLGIVIFRKPNQNYSTRLSKSMGNLFRAHAGQMCEVLKGNAESLLGLMYGAEPSGTTSVVCGAIQGTVIPGIIEQIEKQKSTIKDPKVIKAYDEFQKDMVDYLKYVYGKFCHGDNLNVEALVKSLTYLHNNVCGDGMMIEDMATAVERYSYNLLYSIEKGTE
jgi:hypothetical protein